MKSQNLDWIEKLKQADMVCSCCHVAYNETSNDGSWRFTGFHWEHHCENSGQSGHFIGVARKQLEKVLNDHKRRDN